MKKRRFLSYLPILIFIISWFGYATYSHRVSLNFILDQAILRESSTILNSLENGDRIFMRDFLIRIQQNGFDSAEFIISSDFSNIFKDLRVGNDSKFLLSGFVIQKNIFINGLKIGKLQGFVSYLTFIKFATKKDGLMVVIILLLGIFLIYWGNKSANKELDILIKIIKNSIENLKAGGINYNKIIEEAQKLSVKEELFISVINLLKEQEKFIKSEQKAKTFSTIAQQVSHDIRSPLSALNMVIHDISEISEERRLLIRNAVKRINDIANDLLQKGKQFQILNSNNIQNPLKYIDLSSILLPAVIEEIVSEKRIQFRDRINVNIESDLRLSFGIFVSSNSIELKRIISNLINNSIESFKNDSGEVRISVRADKNNVIIVVKDNGIGMSKETLNLIGTQGFTIGKESIASGNGLGVSHAQKTIKEWGGFLTYRSKLYDGTEAEIKLPRSENPEWFPELIRLNAEATVVIVDDDVTIHQIWKRRFDAKDISSERLKFLNFTSTNELLNYKLDDSMYFLIDFEFLGQNINGLQLIKKLGIYTRSLLVTSRYEDKNILEFCTKFKTKLLPKQLAELIPIEIIKLNENIDYVLIDDDPLIRSTWLLLAQKYEKKIKVFDTLNEFLIEEPSISRSVIMYIDVQLGNNQRGEDVAKVVYSLGFEKIYFATGFCPDNLNLPSFVCGAVGKDFPVFK